MILVSLIETGNGIGFEISGHADFAVKGRDVVCSAVSAMVQMAEVGMNQILGLKKNSQKNRVF